MKYYYDYRFPIGNLTIEEDGHGICGIYFGIKKLEGEKKNTELIREAALQLSQYFDGRRKKFDLKLSYLWNGISDKGMEGIARDSIWNNLYIQRYCRTCRNSKRMPCCRYGK